MMQTESRIVHRVQRHQSHIGWDNSLPPILTSDPGDTVVVETPDPTDGQVTRNCPVETFVSFDFSRLHRIAGPIAVRGARPGDVLEVEIQDIEPGSWGWTAISPDFGLLADEFPEAYAVFWDLEGRETAVLRPGIEIPFEPFCGIMGVATDEPGRHPTLPPHKGGGNMDNKLLRPGSRLFLPVWVDGALFSCGDAHFAQGDGEVCGTAIEMQATATLRFQLHRDRRLAEPHILAAPPRRVAGPCHAATGYAPDLMEATRKAVRHLIDHLVETRGLSRPEAYILCSVAADLRISEVVDRPNWVVSACLPLDVFR